MLCAHRTAPEQRCRDSCAQHKSQRADTGCNAPADANSKHVLRMLYILTAVSSADAERGATQLCLRQATQARSAKQALLMCRCKRLDVPEV